MSAIDPAPAPRRTRLTAAIVVLIAFVAGILVGGAGVWMWGMRMRHRVHVSGMQFMADRILNRLDRDLDLSADQRGQIEKILTTRTRRIDGLWMNVGPQVRREIDATNGEIERVLNPGQRAKFQKLKMRFHRRGPPPLPLPPPPR